MSTADVARALGGGPPPPTDDHNLALWQGRIAVAAANGGGLDIFKAALEAVKQIVPPDRARLEHAKREIWGAAERHLADVYGTAVLDTHYLSVFPEDATSNDAEIASTNAELDALATDKDDFATVASLAALDPIKYARQRSAVAQDLGIGVAALDRAVKEFKAGGPDTKGQGRALELPEIDPWPLPVDGANLLSDICRAIRKYLVLPAGSAEALALWAVHTHAFDCFAHSPRLAITSPEKGCGKTTTLDVVGELVARPLSTSNATVSAVFRTVEMAKPTLLIDEADTFLKENDELRGILNAGHRKGGKIIRTVGDDHEPRQFSTWAPAAIAMIGRLPDTLDDRAVTVRLRRRKPTERIEAFRSDRVTDLHELARKAARWTADNRAALAATDPDTGTLFNRTADNWRPLLAVADVAGGDWPALARSVAEGAEAIKEDQSVRAMLLGDVRDIFAMKPHSDRISSMELAASLGAMEGRPWAEWRHGMPMTAAGLARMLGPFGIAPGTKRAGGETFKGYLVSDFWDAFTSYLADQIVTPSQLNNDAPCDALQNVTHAQHVTVSEPSQSNSDGHCDGVTVCADVDEKEEAWTV